MSELPRFCSKSFWNELERSQKGRLEFPSPAKEKRKVKKGKTSTLNTSHDILFQEKGKRTRYISIGNSLICSDIGHKYYEWYFKIATFHEPLGEWNLRQFWNITSGIYAKYHVQIVLLFVYTTTRKRFVIFTCRYFNLSWSTTALSRSNCRIFSCSGINKYKSQGRKYPLHIRRIDIKSL